MIPVKNELRNHYGGCRIGERIARLVQFLFGSNCNPVDHERCLPTSEPGSQYSRPGNRCLSGTVTPAPAAIHAALSLSRTRRGINSRQLSAAASKGSAASVDHTPPSRSTHACSAQTSNGALVTHSDSDPGQPPHIVMVVANSIYADTRVKKTALSAATAGLRVTVVGISPTQQREESTLGSARVIRVPNKQIMTRTKSQSGHARRDIPRMKQLIERRSYERRLAQRELAASLGVLRSKVLEVKALAATDTRRHKLRAVERSKLRAARLARFQRRACHGHGGHIGRLGKAALSMVRATIRAWNHLDRTYLTTLRIGTVRRKALAERRALAARMRILRRRHRLADRLRRARIQHYRKRLVRAQNQGSRARRTKAPSWRRDIPELHDFELAIGPVIDELEPDLIHAHDFPVLGIAQRAAARAANKGKRCICLYDAHEYVAGIAISNDVKRRAYLALEREYIQRCQAVITVSDPIAEKLAARYKLAHRPDVVLNAPLVRDKSEPLPHDFRDLRETIGLLEGVPLLVYSGNVSRERGLSTALEAVALSADVHIAVVSDASANLDELVKLAASVGITSRFHVAPYVEPHLVPAYLASATAAIHPLPKGPMNHELALPNKLFEYVHAGLPSIVSDCETMSGFVRAHGIGEVFTSGDPLDCARAINRILERPGLYAARLSDGQLLEQTSWATQEEILLKVYSEQLNWRSAQRGHAQPECLVEHWRSSGDTTTSLALALGPRNTAGQAAAWADALRARVPRLQTEVYSLERPGAFGFPADHVVPARSWTSFEWQARHARYVFERFTHVLMEAGLGILGSMNGGAFYGDLVALSSRGIRCGIVLHGSEVRDPSLHARTEPSSPFRRDTELRRRLQKVVDELRPRIAEFRGPKFVSTLGLLEFVDDAIWLPLTVDPAQWIAPEPPQLRPGSIPRVVHAPSNDLLKGSVYVDAVCERLAAEGLIHYTRLTGVPYADMPAALGQADIQIDGLALGDYGVTACQSMSLQRLTIGNVNDRIRQRLECRLPIVQATPATLEEVLRAVAARPEAYMHVALSGRDFIFRYHSGELAAEVIESNFLLD